MKTIGLLGGMSWVSTIEYYRILNQKIHARLGKHHSANIILHSIDYEAIKQYNYQNWEAIEEILLDEMINLSSSGVDCMLLCNNTLHRAYDAIEPFIYDTYIPFFHIVDCVGEYAQKRGISKVLLLGTKFTMEDGFYQTKLQKYHIQTIIPDETERIEIQRIIQEELVQEKILERSKTWFQSLITKYPCDGVIVGCTELPLLIRPEDYTLPILNTLEIQCEKVVEYILSVP